MPLTAGVTVADDADGPVRPGWFVGVITTTIKAISHVERSRGWRTTGRVPTGDLIVNIVTARGESWRPATRNGRCRRRPW